jgi:N-acetylglutamate synthase-like GNAT family acetyltransferase
MVLKGRHKTGLGRRLLAERLERLASYPTTRIVFLNTSQFSAGFFAKMGFETQLATPDGYLAGMDKHEMSARLPL